MDNDFDLNLFLNGLGLGCWGVCFWWMHRISQRQDNMLREMHEVMRRTEEFSRAEHDIIKEVHPKVAMIEKRMDEVAEDVRDAARPQ